MNKGEYELKGRGISRGSSLFTPDPQTQLLNAIRQKDIRTFKRLLQTDSVDPDHCYDYPDYKTCLDIACSDTGYSAFVKLLLERNVDVNKVNDTHRKAPIHFAAETGDLDTIRTLLDDPNIEVNAMTKGNTAIHLAIKHIEDVDEDRDKIISQYEEIVEALLKSNSDVNIPDMKRITPIYSAAKQGLERVVELIIEYSKKPVDLDSYKDRKKMSARMIIQETFPHLLSKLPSQENYNDIIDVHKLFSHLSGHDEDSFIADFNKIKKSKDLPKILSENNGSKTLLQTVCAIGLDKAAKILLEYKADPNLTAPGSNVRPIELACSNGYSDVLKTLLSDEKTSYEPVNGESLIQIVIKDAKHLNGETKSDYKECLKVLLEHPKIKTDINFLDYKENTALHYAARSGDQDIVMALLKNGACIGIRNKFNEPPLADMSAKTLETYLDDCLTTNNERPNDDNYELQFDYSFLAPPGNIHNHETKIPLMDDSDVTISSNDRFLAPETDALLYMTQCSELKPLLKHPVITSFLYLKWQRISCLFYANISFYAVFCLSLILYILLGYGGQPEKSDLILTIAYLTRILSIIGLILLIIREVLQIAVSPKVYFKSIENWLEIMLIFITAAIVFNDSTSEHSKQQLSAIAILLSSAEFVLLIGQFPHLSTNIVMLKTVSWNFFKFLLWYCILIIAFSLSFYTLFRTIETDDPNGEKVAFDPNKPAGSDDDEQNFFLDPGISLFKTIVMLTGEFDAGSINFEAFPITSHIIFVIFVFMIPIVLFNLLNGLAVSDTQTIKANAELVGHISRIKLISYFESVILGDLGPYKNAVSSAQNACCWLPGNNCIRSRMICIKPLARRVCLFPNFLPMAQIGVKTNQACRVEVCTTDRQKKKNEQNADNPQLVLCCLPQCNQTLMDWKIVKAAKKLIAEREEGGSEMKQLQDKLLTCERKLHSFEKSHEKIERLLEHICHSLNK